MIDPLTFIALLPAVVLVVYICRKDRTDKEPPALLAKLLGFGALSCLPAIVVELILSAIIMAGRLALAHQAIQAVAYDAARAASVARDRSTASRRLMSGSRVGRTGINGRRNPWRAWA